MEKENREKYKTGPVVKEEIESRPGNIRNDMPVTWDRRAEMWDKSKKNRDKGAAAHAGLERAKLLVRDGKEKIRVFRKERREKRFENGEVELPVFRVGPNKKGVAALWILMGASLAFGVYKNFTAIDKETIRETTVVEAEVTDTNAVESFVTRFAYLYHAWNNDYRMKSEREESLKAYMTDDLVKVNSGAVNSDCPTKSEVEEVRICEVTDLKEGEYEVRYSVLQCLTETVDVESTASVTKKDVPVVATGASGKREEAADQSGDSDAGNMEFQGTQTGDTAEDVLGDESADPSPDETGQNTDPQEQTGTGNIETVQNENGITTITKRESFYIVQVHADESGMVITKNPTACGVPGRSSYVPPVYQNDGSVDTSTMADIEEFLNTFFTLYPTATEKELVYYAKPGTMDVINADFIYDGLRNATYYIEDEQIKVHVYVRYLDQTAKMTQISEYTLTLEKGDNWKIAEAK